MAKSNAQQAQKTRPPVVVVLGHVDHGKTTLLDTIRKTRVAQKESGGITQHIGAYQVETNGRKITFLDTPGHEAFTAIRSRGARVADVAVLVVAADEGVKPQTKEAVAIIQETKTPFLVAINKIDRENANPQRVKQDLAAENVLVEDWGGTVPSIEISAKEGKNINELLDLILLLADLEETIEDLSSPAEGVVIEANLDKQIGNVATVLVQKGIVHAGDWIVSGSVLGKIRNLENFAGKTVLEARPSDPVRIIGLPSPPQIGKPFVASSVKEEAEEHLESEMPFAALFSFLTESPNEPGMQVLPLVFKSDVSSSLEAMEAMLRAISIPGVTCRVLSYGVGNIAEADIKTAVSSNALVVGFRVGVEPSAQRAAERDNITIATFDVIYELIADVRKRMNMMLGPQITRTVVGKLKVLALFRHEGKVQIAGGKVTSGVLVRGVFIDALRAGELVHIGRLTQLQHNKEDMTEVNEGSEAGMKIELIDGSNPVREGDILEIYKEEETERS